MAEQARDWTDDDEVDPRLVTLVEQALLFGKVDELDTLLGWVVEEDGFPKDFLHDIEVLRHFRSYYGRETERFSEEDQRLIVQWDADWAMHLIKRLHQKFMGPSLERPMSPFKRSNA